MEHTKTPWIIAESDKRFVYALNDKGYNRFSFLVQGDGSNTPVEELEANAHFIVKACNAHATLVTMLQDARDELAAYGEENIEVVSEITETLKGLED